LFLSVSTQTPVKPETDTVEESTQQQQQQQQQHPPSSRQQQRQQKQNNEQKEETTKEEIPTTKIGPNLSRLWSYECGSTKGLSVVCMVWNKQNPVRALPLIL